MMQEDKWAAVKAEVDSTVGFDTGDTLMTLREL